MDSLEELINMNKCVKFRCEAAGGKSGEFIAETETILYPPSDNGFDEAKNRISGIRDDLLSFYKKNNGAEFHKQINDIESGLSLYPIESWGEATESMMDWYDMIDEDELDEIDMDWLENCIAFSEVPSSGNYFVLVLNGKDKGKIIYTDHEVAEPEIYADNFVDFLTRYLTDPAKEMYDLGCFTRYSDGKTNTQWIPREVV